MNILISTAGSHGDVLPFIALGREFSRRWHAVTLYANPVFQGHAQDAGLGFVPVGTLAEYQALGQQPYNNPTKAFERVARYFASLWGECYRTMQADIVPGQTFLIGNSLMFSHRLLRETDGIPCATVHLAPSVFRSNKRPARLLPNWIKPQTPELFKSLAWWMLDKTFYDRHLTKPLNALRTKLGLPPVERLFRSWLHEADCVVGMFPEWFANRASDWPIEAELTGFPLYDHGEVFPLPESLAAFIDAGPPPVAFSAGTATATAHQFFESSVAACQRAGVRGILLSHVTDQVPANLPTAIMHVPYAPFGALLPKLAAFVHHGGIGSTAQALRAGVPQLIWPTAYDQFDNAARTVQLGVGIEVLEKRYRPEYVASVLRQLIGDKALHARCADIAGKLQNNQAIQRACTHILQHLEPLAYHSLGRQQA